MIYLHFVYVSKHSVYSVVDGVDDVQTKLHPVAFMLRPLQSTATQAG